ncbi:hypothetical protein KIH39_07965 [Telmatocola sphagniphila]|uniref:Uncharacterized protein n=1 Tax=Telmatocola sphagniphila TaxID=1123043 RepID=A0A8E6BBD5_9BACT|nr:hypothetical protein [Telmatocola sphagniphila]QVL33830.1 hypothetical protein KIH39_07965 [Telmatocola sphagniphila]
MNEPQNPATPAPGKASSDPNPIAPKSAEVPNTPPINLENKQVKTASEMTIAVPPPTKDAGESPPGKDPRELYPDFGCSLLIKWFLILFCVFVVLGIAGFILILDRCGGFP